MENNHDIDKKFNEASKAEEPATFPGFDKVWAQVEEKLDTKENKKRIIPIWLPYGIAASLIIGLGAFYFINKNNISEIKKTTIVQKTVSPTSNPNIQTIDSMVKSNIEKKVKGENISKKTSQVLAYEDVSSKPNNNSLFETSNEKSKNIETGIIENKQYQKQRDTNLIKSIEEVVVTGYSTVRKKDYTSSSVVVSSAVITANKVKQYNDSKVSTGGYIAGNDKGYFDNQPYNNKTVNSLKQDILPSASVINILQGNVSGLNINSGIEQPGANSQVTIRGIASLNGNTQPLYMINGKVSNAKAFGKLNPNTIESVNVLRGPSATAIYGSKASNGVIVITTKKLSRKERKAYEKLQKAQDSIKKAKFIEKQNDEEYDAFIENPFELTKNQSVSTFSIDVDNAAYSNIRRMINNGEMVDKNAVRIEEMINYFKYSYPQPKNDQPFSINTEYSDTPWNPKHKLLKIGLQGKNIPEDMLPASNFVFLIDVSGSMDAANKLPLLKSSFKVLLDQLRPKDKVGIVVYAGSAGMVLSPTSAGEKDKIIGALDKLQAGGSTAGGEGIELAYKLAQENFIKGGNNRVIIATDGDFNVGASSTEDLQTLVEEKRKSGVFLTCLGFGMGNFKDNRMETLADKGNGNYAYIDNMQEANKFLAKEFAGSMYAIAKDVKIQIEFNPQYVKSYRLIGYENRKLRNEDFTNDVIDAGELGSGHTVTALYEIIPNDVSSDFLPKETELKYSNQTSRPNFGDELATVKFRYKKPDGDKSTEITQVVKKSDVSISGASDDFKFASSVAWFGLILRNSKLIQNKDLKQVESLAKKGRGKDDEGYRAEFIRLVESYKTQQ
ncbi:von Willebrand factor type A domain-containing protein [Chryseobacterium sp. Y16C]|uniref:vWA domain-containing protein n=1 Tax=Chryseobacterium sp. Y16C TaxID=2920939 RepID=UPI001F0BEECB|nr:VWA domain-containing protein [Chryseobacterium sp. Y16C]UMQ43472.1 von Willebrand factor type A domain-containing protein [Chryseobacterium sp. Y16C]